MKILLTNARINGNDSDILISNQKIEKISAAGKLKDDNARIIDCKGCYVTPGWFDMRASFREPGHEQKETIRTGQDAAAQGGFTHVLTMPSTDPAIQSRSDVESVIMKSNDHVVSVHQAGALTVNRAGKDLAELFDMRQGGAVAFTDDKRFIADGGVMMRALQYADNINARILSYADDVTVSGTAMVNESVNTMMLGLKGAPAAAEMIALQRDIELVKYTGVPLHISGVSCEGSVDIIRKAKADGLPVTAEVYMHHLVLDDSMLESFDSNYKVKPPLRSESDRLALIEAVIDGSIDVIASDHSPEDTESKMVEFDYAKYGMIALESFPGLVTSAFGKLLSEELIRRVLCINPRRILGLTVEDISEGSTADITIFDPEKEWVFSQQHIRSKSRNTPFLNRKMKGKVIAVLNNGKLVVPN